MEYLSKDGLSHFSDKLKKTYATKSSVDAVIATIKAFQSQNNFVGFARVSGDADPTPSDEFVYGNRELLKEIGKHFKIGTVKRVGNEAVLQHECAPGRITQAVDGSDLAVDGTDGDLMIYTDIPLYFLKANEMVGTNEMSCIGIGAVPIYWQNRLAKTIEPFAFTPFSTVQAKLDGDERSQAHCIISDSVAGTYTAPNGMFKETFKSSGAGYHTLSVSSLNSIHQAQNKNADANTNYPYMGGYYEFYELWISMMYAECGNLNTTDLYSMGVGCTTQDNANASTWNNEKIAANSGIKIFKSDGTEVAYSNINASNIKVGASDTNTSHLNALVGSNIYGFTKCGETLSVLDAIVKANLQSKIGSNANIFYFGEDGNIVCSSDGRINLNTGVGMEANKRYYIVRNVPNCQGIADGVLTAVVNCYVKMSYADNTFTGSTDLTGGYCIIKFSHSCYRGLCIPMDGNFIQLSGAHYVTGRKSEKEYYNKFYFSDKWQYVAPITNDTAYGDIGTETTFDIIKGLNNVVDVPGLQSWVKCSDYSKSLFCFSAFSGNAHTHEDCYTWNNNYMWGYGSNGLPNVGKVGAKALSVGCRASSGYASARTAYCSDAVSAGNTCSAGAFAVPLLKFRA